MEFRQTGFVEGTQTVGMFQSLFFWIWNSDNEGPGSGEKQQPGFNPCFSGYGIQTIYDTSAGGSVAGCFNPCFSGYGIQTKGQLGQNIAGFEFQSLFFWIWNSDQ